MGNDLVSENASNDLFLAHCSGRRNRRSRVEAFKNEDYTRGQSQQSDDAYPDSFQHIYSELYIAKCITMLRNPASSLLPFYRHCLVAMPIPDCFSSPRVAIQARPNSPNNLQSASAHL